MMHMFHTTGGSTPRLACGGTNSFGAATNALAFC